MRYCVNGGSGRGGVDHTNGFAGQCSFPIYSQGVKKKA